MRSTASVATLVLTVFALSLSACGGDSESPTEPDPGDSEPQVGALSVSASTSGEDQDTTGYTAEISGPSSSSASLTTDGSTTFTSLDPGDYDVTLADTASNCSVDGSNPKTKSVTAGDTASASFSVTCNARTGSMEASVSTTGSTLDSDGYQVAVGGVTDSLPTSGSTVLSGVPTGQDSAVLSGIQKNCTAGQTSTAVSIAENDTASASFSVTCDQALFGGYLYIREDASGYYDIQRVTSGGTQTWYSFHYTVDNVHSLVISGDGTDVAYVASDSTATADSLYVRDIGGTTSVVGARTGLGFPDFGSDGDSLVAVEGGRLTSNRLAILDRSLSAVRYLTDTTTADGDPDWKPNSRTIAFASNRQNSTNLDIYSMDLDTGGLTQVIGTTNEHESFPTYSPSGDRLVYTSVNDSVGVTLGTKLVVSDADGSNPQVIRDITSASGDYLYEPRWGPQGNWIYFTETDQSANERHIYRIDPSGTSLEQLTNTGAYNVWATPEPVREP